MAIWSGAQATLVLNAGPGLWVQAYAGVPAAPSVTSTATPTVTAYMGQQTPTFSDGFVDGEQFGFSSPQDRAPASIKLGETDPDKKVVDFYIYTSTGLPASGVYGAGAVLVPSAGDVQVNRDLAGYVNIAGTFAQLSDHKYRYTFTDAEIVGPNEGSVWVRVKRTGYRTVVRQVYLRLGAPSSTEIRNAIFNAARTGHITTGTVGEGVAIAVALLQGNVYMDTVTNTVNGQTVSRVRCFHTGAAAAAATAGGSGQGEFATFTVTTTYNGISKIATHRVVQQ